MASNNYTSVVPLVYGTKTLKDVPSNSTYPIEHLDGNRICLVKDNNKEVHKTFYVLNINAENLEEAERKFLTDKKVKVRFYPDSMICLVVDTRIPKDWYSGQFSDKKSGNHQEQEDFTDAYTYMNTKTN